MSTGSWHISPRETRIAVRDWLQEEKATIEQALELESAIYAGAIDGGTYKGKRDWDETIVEAVDTSPVRSLSSSPYDGYESCGCLLDTFERIQHKRPLRDIKGQSLTAFSAALMLRLGHTPKNNPWAAAAVKGIADYVARLEKANG
jgi:hypothetical protein